MKLLIVLSIFLEFYPPQFLFWVPVVRPPVFGHQLLTPIFYDHSPISWQSLFTVMSSKHLPPSLHYQRLYHQHCHQNALPHFHWIHGDLVDLVNILHLISIWYHQHHHLYHCHQNALPHSHQIHGDPVDLVDILHFQGVHTALLVWQGNHLSNIQFQSHTKIINQY